MDQKTRTSVLLAKGYFPKELPSAFTTSDFGRDAVDLTEWLSAHLVERKAPGKYQGKVKSGSYYYKIDHADAEIISTPKRGYERRNLHVTHPIPQAFLTWELSSNWKSIQKWLSKQTFSLDKVMVSETASRGIPDINFIAHRAKKAFIEATANWVVKTDITRIYPSIYTHSIPWAAYGKENVKAKIKLYEGSLADRIDQLLRSCNRNQTVGIPIGPETSRIVAEIVSARVEDGFRSSNHGLSLTEIDRLQDDWFIGCDTFDQAEVAISSVIRSYRGYGLELNGSKTFIERSNAVSEEQWVSELGSFLSHGNAVPYGKGLAEFLSLGVRMQVLHPSKPVINYVISIVENGKVFRRDAGVVESFLLKSIALSPSSLSGIARVLINLHHDTKALSITRVAKRVRQELVRHLKNGNTFEVLWLLYILRGLSAHVRVSEIAEFIAVPQSSVVSLVLLDMDNRGLVIGSLPKTRWADFVDDQISRTSGLWLLAYEGIRHGWPTDPHGLAALPFFKPMLDRDIVFYDPRRNVPTSKATTTRRRRARRTARRATFALIQSLRGFEDEY